MPPARAPLVQLADSNGDPIPSSPGSGFPVSEPTAVTLYSEALTTRNASGNTANFVWPATVSSVFVGINLTVLSGGTTPTLVVQLQQMDANGVFQVIGSNTALNAVGTANYSVGDGQTTGATIAAGGTYRLAWVVTGAPTTCTFQIGMSGR